MATVKQPEIRYFKNNTAHCTIGIDPVALIGVKLPDHHDGKPWVLPTLYRGGQAWFLPPGAVWVDAVGYHQTMIQGVYNMQMFVHCESEDEFLLLKSKFPELEPVKDGSKLKGFFGASYVLDDVTHLHEKFISEAVMYMSGEGYVAKLREEAAQFVTAKEAAVKATGERDAIMAEHSKLKAEMAHLRSVIESNKKK